MTRSGVDLHSGDPFHVHMTYDGTNLVMTITDTITNASFSHTWPVDIPTIVDGDSAYVGFTGGTGGLTAIQNILNWTYVATGGQGVVATPTFSPAAGTYLGTQTVTLSDATSGATIYYTTDGTTPTTSSTQYTAPIAVTFTQTINAIATAASSTTSAVGTATYTIESQVAAPTFSPASGTFFNSVTVTLFCTSLVRRSTTRPTEQHRRHHRRSTPAPITVSSPRNDSSDCRCQWILQQQCFLPQPIRSRAGEAQS